MIAVDGVLPSLPELPELPRMLKTLSERLPQMVRLRLTVSTTEIDTFKRGKESER
jgi:hypothetical protein